MRTIISLCAAMVLIAGIATTVLADPTLEVVETTGDYYTITAKDSSDASVTYWEVKVDIQSGCIYSFKDLTDAGDGQGGHTNYMGTNDGYSRQCGMLEFVGRGGRVFTRKLPLIDLANRLTFATAGDNSSFTITYTETSQATDFYHGTYVNGSTGIVPGDLLTTIKIVIRPPTLSGTAWDWSVDYENVSGHAITGKVWAVDTIRSNLLATLVETIDEEETRSDGAWNAQSPESYIRRTTGDNSSLGLTQGREFIFDHQTGLAAYPYGGVGSTESWAGFDAMKFNAGYNYDDAALADGVTRTRSGEFIINIVEVPTNQAPVADAGSDQLVHDSDSSGSESVTLDGSGSSDSDGTIASYVWKEGVTQIATGQSPQVSLSAGTHTITLEVTDDDGATDSDTVNIEVNSPPVADAGLDVEVTDTDDDGSETVTLDGSSSSDSDGTIAGYVWKEGATQIATGQSAQVAFAVGVHTVTLEVTDDDGASSSDTVTITVNQAPGHPVLSVVETTGDYYTITAQDSQDSTEKYWEAKVDIQSGCIYSFKDLTDAGDGQGGHTSYLGSNDGYSRQCGLLEFNGRGGRVFTRKLPVTDLGDRLTFTTAADNSSFTITYAETSQATDFYHGTYVNGSTGIVPGDLLTTIEVVITPPDENGTSWDWSIQYENVSGHAITGKVWAVDTVRTQVLDTLVRTLDSETSLADGAWDDQSPESYMRRTIGDNSSLGLTQGREFTVDYEAGLASYPYGGGVTTEVWAGFESAKYQAGFSYDSAELAASATRVNSGKLLIDITGSGQPPANQPPVANAGSDQNVTDSDDSGSETVTLDGSGSSDSDGTIASYVWKEGASQIATGVGPQVSLAVGVHTITLDVTDDGGATDSDTVVVTVNAYTNVAPTANAGPDQNVNDSDGSGSETVTLDGSGSSDSDGTIASYVWKEGASQIATGVGPQVSLGVGVHTITLEVTDDDGATDSDTVVVNVNARPVANAGADIDVTDNDGTGSESVTLDGSGSSDSDGTIASYVWKEGANQIATGVGPQVSLAVGVHTITLDVTDDDGATHSDTVQVTVNEKPNDPPVANAGSDQLVHDADADGSETVTLDGSGSSDSDGTIASYVWKEGASQIATGVSPQVSLSTGVHTIELTVTDDDDATATDTVQITVNVVPVADAGADQTVTDSDGDGSEAVTLDGSGSSDADGTIADYVWKEGASQIATGAGPVVTLSAGPHTLTLTVTDDRGATSQDTVAITVNTPPVADAGPDQSVGDDDDNGSALVTLDGSASSDSDGTITSWVWKEGAAQIATGESPQVSLAVGVHTITLEVTDNDGATDSDTVEVEVTYPVGLAVLDVTETAGDYYTVVAREKYNTGIRYWECKVDILSGGIFSFIDYTDDGTASGHTDYMGNEGYSRQCSLLEFSGRGGHAFTRYSSLTGLDARLSFDTAPDGSAFTITYTETAQATDFFHDSYADGDQSLTAGDLLTTITVVIRPPDGTRTAWDWTVAYENVSDHAISGKVWAIDSVETNLLDSIVKTRDEDETRADGAWNASSPVSYTRYTVGTNTSLGLASGREFILDYQAGLAAYAAGGGISDNIWAGFSYVDYVAAFSYSGGELATSSTRTHSGQLLINIIADGILRNSPPYADAGIDQVVTDFDSNGSETVTLDGSASTDTDGTITSYVWKEGASQIATGQTANVSLNTGVHTITLVVTDDAGGTGSDDVEITVLAGPPVADAGSDQDVLNANGDGSETVNLDGSGSYPTEGTITSWVWTEGTTQIATGETASVALAPGIHLIDLVVTDSYGNTGSDTVEIEVYWPNWARAVTNHLSGISATLSGTGGEDYAIEKVFHEDGLSELVFYMKSSVTVSLAHNEYNTHGVNNEGAPPALVGILGEDGIANSGDEGDIYWKIDRDLQSSVYSAANGTIPGYVHAYSSPIDFSTATYDGTLSVLGTTGDNGGNFGVAPRYTTDIFAYGQTDAYGNEWHTLSYWDDDKTMLEAAGVGASVISRKGASDGNTMFICFNPVTPVISLKAPEGEEFYTTPIKTYHVPKIWDQKTYLTSGVKVNFINLTNTSAIQYRVDGGTWQTYGGTPVRADSIFSQTDTEILLEVRCGTAGEILKRTVVMEPGYPGATETHGNLLWADSTERQAVVTKVHNVEPFKTAYNTIQEEWAQGLTDEVGDARGLWTSGASQASTALNNAFTMAMEGAGNAEEYAQAAKTRLMRMARWQPLGYECTPDWATPGKDFLNELGQTIQMYAEAGVAYDLLAADYRRSQYAGGMSPIEEIWIREGLAKIAKSTLQMRNNWSANVGGGDTHWGHGFELCVGVIAMAMPTYATPYYGVSGADRSTTNTFVDGNGKYWNPFPDQGVTWYACVTDPSISTPGHPNNRFTFRADYLLTDDGWWTGPNDFQGDGDRYFDGHLGNRLVDLRYNGLANAEGRVELVEMQGYESPFVSRLYALDFMRRIKGDNNRALSVTNYLRRRTVGGCVRFTWDGTSKTYTAVEPRAESVIYGFNPQWPWASLPACVTLVGDWLELVNRYEGIGDPLDQETYDRMATDRKFLWDPYALALCIDPNQMPSHQAEPNHAPSLRALFKHVVKPGEQVKKKVVAMDPDGDSLTFTVDYLPTGATWNATTREITWTPGTSDEGVYIVVVTASDGSLETSRAFPIIVKADAGQGPMPNAPTNFSASYDSVNQEVDLSWTAPSSTTVEAYLIYRDGTLWATLPSGTTSYSDNEMVTPASHYRYHISILDDIGAESGAVETTPDILWIPAN